MTEQQTPEQPAPPVQVHATTTPRLAQLHASYAAAKAETEAATDRLKGITDAIKAELAAAAPDQERVHLVGTEGPPLGLTYSESWRVDAKRLKAADPYTYALYAKKSGSWRLAELKGSDVEDGA